MAELTYRDAVAAGIAQEMARDETVVFLGEDVAAAGGVFKATVGLLEKFGPEARARLPDFGAGDPRRGDGRGDDGPEADRRDHVLGFSRGVLGHRRQRNRQNALHDRRPDHAAAGDTHRQRRRLALRRAAFAGGRELGDGDPRHQGGGAGVSGRRQRTARGGGARSRSGAVLRAEVAVFDEGRGARRRIRR